MEGKPVEDLPRQSNLEEGPVEKIMIQDRGPGHTGMVVYVRPEEYKIPAYARRRQDSPDGYAVGSRKIHSRQAGFTGTGRYTTKTP